ncbi:MAG: tRNA (guanosine(46)-N7)-methyltransferase TrmB [Gammaproteobacteria bacterium]
MEGSGPPGSAPPRQREIRSYVLRAGRLTAAQQRALSELWPRFGIAAAAPGAEPLDFDALFGRQAPRVLEIGIGNGAALLGMAAQDPDRDYLGAEVHAPGVGHCLLEIERLGLGNVRLFMEDAVGVLRHRLADASLAGLHLFFPDPWHKKRHHKRRLVQPPFVELLARRLAADGYFHVATDWPPYAEHIAAVLEASNRFGTGIDPASGGRRPLTRFEARGQRLGHPIWERIYPRRGA